MALTHPIPTQERCGDYTGVWDPHLMRRIAAALRPLTKGWFRSEVRGIEHVPPGGSLIVANHSGGLFAMDIPVFASEFFAQPADITVPAYAGTINLRYARPAASRAPSAP